MKFFSPVLLLLVFFFSCVSTPAPAALEDRAAGRETHMVPELTAFSADNPEPILPVQSNEAEILTAVLEIPSVISHETFPLSQPSVNEISLFPEPPAPVVFVRETSVTVPFLP